MKEVRYFYVPDACHRDELPVDEANHALRVLRLQSGDQMFLMDGNGAFYEAEVTLASSKHCHYRITNTLVQEKAWKGKIHLGIAPTKMMERIEWMAEKSTEIGIDEFSFLHCKFSERKVLKKERIEKIVVSAMKQSRKPWMPVVHEMTAFRDFIDAHTTGHRYICHCYNEIEKKDLYTELLLLGKDEAMPEVTILVGPEGDFSIDEVNYALSQGFESVSLGNARLRTETAGLSGVMMAQLAMRK